MTDLCSLIGVCHFLERLTVFPQLKFSLTSYHHLLVRINQNYLPTGLDHHANCSLLHLNTKQPNAREGDQELRVFHSGKASLALLFLFSCYVFADRRRKLDILICLKIVFIDNKMLI